MVGSVYHQNEICHYGFIDLGPFLIPNEYLCHNRSERGCILRTSGWAWPADLHEELFGDALCSAKDVILEHAKQPRHVVLVEEAWRRRGGGGGGWGGEESL